MQADEMITKDDHLESVNALRAEYLGRYMAAVKEVERLRAILRGLVSAIDNDNADTMLLSSAAYIEAQRIADADR